MYYTYKSLQTISRIKKRIFQYLLYSCILKLSNGHENITNHIITILIHDSVLTFIEQYYQNYGKLNYTFKDRK